ncbi:hypothetical protein I302_104962 [Kwoniella bestiolae CBS 10118]|uniref:Ribosome biogenesis protein NSA1 n=1 Tax=Kwoniella bestiolae CBS 10118 TaxID=1296100 RepID=A0A1B9FRA3_9TREE|nr:hypothetical protein I302_08967 [Kwoniella bestiolae CBS 10118]OCF21294.1 hypothetical protein I302_08967 [Kwoniella bestiolae CBS 10118]
MVQSQTLNFLVPSLHPNTLIDLSFPSPSLGLVPSAPEPIVQHLPIKYGEHHPLGRAKRMVKTGDERVIIADDKFQISTLELSPLDQEEASPPVVVAQESVKGRKKDIWAGMTGVQGGVVSALTSGLLTYHPTSKSGIEAEETPKASSSRSVPSPLQCLTSTSASPHSFVTAGKEVDVSIWDIERTFGSSSGGMEEDGPARTWEGGKRKKNVYEVGQIWQAKNVPQNNLSLRQPINHLCLTYLNDSPHLLVSGTKAGTIRRFDLRQRKPLSDWKVAREGGIGCVASGVEQELFFSDQSNLLSSLDLRTGKPLYTYSQMTCTAHQLIPIPSFSAEVESGSRQVGLGSISSDATFRLHTTTTPPSEGQRGNFGGEGKKGEILSMVGGVGVGEGVFRGYSQRDISPPKVEREGGVGEGDGEEGEEEEDDEKVWEEMSEVVDQGREMSEDEYSDSESDVGEEDRVVIRNKPKKRVRKV